MKVMLSSFAAVVILAVVAGFTLKGLEFSSEARNSGDAVRLDVVD